MKGATERMLTNKIVLKVFSDYLARDADFDFSAPLRCLRLGISHVGEEQPQPFALFAYEGFPRQDIKDNHVAGFVHKALQRKDAVTADKIISVHIRHLAL